MNTFEKILSIEVALRGAERVQAFMSKMLVDFGATRDGLSSLGAGLRNLGVVTALIAGGIYDSMSGIVEALEAEKMQATIRGMTNDLRATEAQLKAIDRIAAKGLFDEKAVYDAVIVLDRAGISLNRNLDLVERLGARTGSMKNAAEVISWIAGADFDGTLPMLMRRLMPLGITAEKLTKAGLNVQGTTIQANKNEILDAIEKVIKSEPIVEQLMNTLDAGSRRLTYQFSELLETLGMPFIEPLKIITNHLAAMFQWMKDLNSATNGWAGHFALGSVLLVGLYRVAILLKEIEWSMIFLEAATRAWAFFSSAQAIIQGLKSILAVMRSMTAVQAVNAVLAAAIAAAQRNFVPLAILLGAGIIVGATIWGANKAVNDWRDEEKKKLDKDLDANNQKQEEHKPVRRDDIERVYKRMYGDAWTG